MNNLCIKQAIGDFLRSNTKQIRFDTLFETCNPSIMAYNAMMKAKKLLDSKHAFDDGAIQQLIIWDLPKPVFGSQHHYKYRLYYGKNGERIVGYDNERGKGDHKHIHGQEYPYTFSGLDVLVRDFLDDVKRVKHER